MGNAPHRLMYLNTYLEFIMVFRGVMVPLRKCSLAEAADTGNGYGGKATARTALFRCDGLAGEAGKEDL